MNATRPVNIRREITTGARYPLEKRKLLEVLAVRRGEELSDTVRWALDRALIESGLLEKDAPPS